MSAAELDAEFLSRLEPSRFADLASVQGTAWFGYRFLHPGLRVFLFAHFYRKSYLHCARTIGKRFMHPAVIKDNPLAEASKAQITGLLTATLTADAHGIPYEFWCENTIDFLLRGTMKYPPQPTQMYNKAAITYVLDKWDERNGAGIYIAKAPQLQMEHYVGHPWQDEYQDYLLDLIARKGNKAFWLSRLLYTVKQISLEKATARFGPDTVEDALRFV